jgi:L-ascorbate metabolism protein UlaG (beta-lactamase superfamily)
MHIDLRGLRITWLGHAAFRIVLPGGEVVVIDPWVMGNPACPAAEKKLSRADILLCTHGHFDHIGDAVAIAKEHNCQVVGIFELCTWMQGKGVKQIAPMNKGGTQKVGSLSVTMVHADHSCGILDDGKIIYGGEACGYVVEFANGLKLYHAGDTGPFGDMALIRELYAPEIVMLPIGDLFTMGPREAAHACKLLQPKTVIPMHFGTFPALTGTPDALRKLVAQTGIEVLAMKPGETIG